MNRVTWFAVLAAVGLAGCRTSSSTFLLRDEANMKWKKIGHMAGTPITLRVPTHVKLYVYEKQFLQSVSVGGVSEVRFVATKTPLRDFAQDLLYTDKIVMVDFKRPAAGALNLRVNYTKDQYISSVQQDITDETIARVGEFFQRLGGSGLIPTSVEPGKEVEEKVKEVKSVLAVGYFEIDAPDFEQQVMNFLNCHLNRPCAACPSAPATIGVPLWEAPAAGE